MKKIISCLALFAVVNADAVDEQQYCHTEVVLKNMTMSKATHLSVTLQPETYPTWNPVWSNTSILLHEAVNVTMTYLNLHGTPPQQFNSEFIVMDDRGGACTFSPWLITSCETVWNWQCTTNASFQPVFWHLHTNHWRVNDLSPWVISFQSV